MSWENTLLIREQDPLKQGLKPQSFTLAECPAHTHIREQDPLKQGLKQNSDITQKFHPESYSRARSIKTRIETFHSTSFSFEYFSFASKIH